jgi:hypothetical protein
VKKGKPDIFQRERRGVSLVEVTVAVLLVSIMLAASMRSVAVSRMVDYKVANAARGKLLAQGLLAEILQQAYADPVVASTTLGPDAANLETSRATYNDVDDYNGWTESPPKNRDGTLLSSDMTGWGRSVKVEWVNPASLTASASVTETHCKRVTVTVTYNGATVATMVGVRTDAP